MYCCLSPIQFDLSDLFLDLVVDSEKQIKKSTSIRNYHQDKSRIEKIKNFKKLNESFQPSVPRCNFSVYEISPFLESKLKERFWLIEELFSMAYFRYQLVSGTGVLLPHRDENRKSSIIVLLKGEGHSEFFEEDIDNNSIFPDPDHLKSAFTCNIGIGETWIYNHYSIHSVKIVKPPRIALSIGFDDLSVNELYDYVQSKTTNVRPS